VSNIVYPAGFAGNWAGGQIMASNSQSVTVTFSPVAPTNYSGIITVTSDATSGSNTIPVTAFGANTNLLLTLITNGEGSITPKDAKVLKENQKITLKAVAGSADVFAGWTGSTNSTNNPLTFFMEQSTILQANFIPNPFLVFVGTYNGLFWASNGIITEGTAGMLKGLTLNSKGAYSASLLINGASKGISGTFAATGETTKSVSLGSQKGVVNVELVLTSNEPAPQITGTISGNGWISTNLIADRATNNDQISTAYTILIPPDTNAASAPIGYGYALISASLGTTKTAATAKITGALADGTTFSQTVSVSKDSYVPLYANLYGGKGLLLGWVSLDPVNATNAPGELFWVHPVGRPGLFPDAFISTNEIALSPWTNPPTGAALATNLIVLEMAPNSPVQTNDFTLVISNGLKLGKLSGPLNLSGSINTKTGLVTLGIGAGSAKKTGYGVILPNGTNGGGYFLTRTNSGAILLQP
jgi:hypothetical protein